LTVPSELCTPVALTSVTSLRVAVSLLAQRPGRRTIL
jgi:hypothetical protein